MSFGQIRSRIIKRWWIVLATTFIFIIGFFPWVNSVSYQASIAVAVGFNSKTFATSTSSTTNPSVDITKSVAYVQIMDEFTKYLAARFSSIEIQNTVANSIDKKPKSYSEKNPFYEITPAAAGFVNVSYNDNNTVDQGNKFLTGVKTAYAEIVDEWNESRLDEYQITKMDKFSEAVVQSEKPLQFQILPVVVGWIFGLVVAASFPEKQENK